MGQKTLVTEKETRGRKTVNLRELSVLEKERIYQQHLGLVISIAKKYIYRSPDFTFEDLIQEGILGLFRAAEKFDEQKGYKFSTYATWWIKQFIMGALDECGRTIRIPINGIEALNKYRKARKKLSQELGQEPLMEEIAAEMGTTINKAQRIRKFLENSPKIISFKTSMEQDGCNVWSELIEDTKINSPVVLASENIFKEDLKKTLKENLTSREEKIIKKRFGLEDGINHSLQEIAEEMRLSRERVRQILKEALKRLRKNKEP